MRRRPTPGARFISKGLAVLYEDKDILVVDKPAGLLTVATEREKSRTAHSLLTDYFRKGCGRSQKRVFVVHRLDRETSGVLIFAKSEEAMLRLKANWKQTEKKYLAVVHGTCEKGSDTITTYLAEDKAYNVYSTSDSTKGRLSQTAYNVLRVTKGLSLLEVVLLTGRKNQIRVHLAGIGHPIVGDTKYGKEDVSQPRMALHARLISFRHPFSGERLTFESEVPAFFPALVGRIDLLNDPAEPSTGPGEDHIEDTKNTTEFCDLECKYARFPKSDAVDGSRSCRTFVALHCTRKKKLVHKNLSCSDKAVKKR